MKILLSKDIKKFTLIHYGDTKYSLRKFKPIKNDWIKPDGGLWTSPVDSPYGWKQWCESERYELGEFEKGSFKLRLKRKARILVIDSVEDLRMLPQINTCSTRTLAYIDFEAISKIADAVWLTYIGQQKTRYSKPSLYGWDIESVLILNKYFCYQIKDNVKIKL